MNFLRVVQRGDLSEIRKQVTKDRTLLYSSNKLGDSPLLVAARHGHARILEFLADECQISLSQTNADGKSALHEAACTEQPACIRYLLTKNVDIDPLKRADWTPLMMACSKRVLESVVLLVQAGARLGLRNKDGWTCFHIACREGNVDILNYLLDVSPNCWETVSKNGRSPLHTTALHKKTNAVRILLSRCRYRRDQKDSCGVTPLMDAVRADSTEIIETLIKEQKADVNALDSLGRQSIHHGAQSGSIAAISLLLDRMVSVNTETTNTGMTPLLYAAKEGHLTTIEYLLQKGASLHSKDHKGRTVLHMASSGGHSEMISVFLLKYGLQDSADTTGQTARSVAKNEQTAIQFDHQFLDKEPVHTRETFP